ncbi:MAG: C-GCAxxG-C-C family protein [Bacteroidales bacterium]
MNSNYNNDNLTDVNNIDLTKSPRAVKAMSLFHDGGYACAASTFLAFNDLVDMPFDQAAKLASSFGAGMGRLREVCGALTGIFMAAGLLYGYADTTDAEEKTAHYVRIQALSKRFREITSAMLGDDTIICRELLHLDIKGADDPRPQPRTENYYATRPCEKLIGIGAYVLEEYMNENEAK